MKIQRLTELNVFSGRCYGCGSIGELGIRYLGPAGSVLFVCSADCWNKHFADYLGRLDDLIDVAPADALRCDNCDREIPNRKREHEREFCSIACINKFHTNRREANDARRLEKAVAAAAIQFKWKDEDAPAACPKCGHREHGEICINADSDNECDCTFTARIVPGDRYARAIAIDNLPLIKTPELDRPPESLGFAETKPADIVAYSDSQKVDPAGPDSFGGEDFPNYPLGNAAADYSKPCPVCDRGFGPAARIRVDDWIVCSLGCRDRYIREKEKRESEQAARKANDELRTAGILKAAHKLARIWIGAGGTARGLIDAGSPELFEAITDLTNRAADKTK